MSAPETRDLTLRLYGLEHMSGKVRFDVFVDKLRALKAGLVAVDRAKNGGRRHEFVVEHLEIGSAVVAIHEKRTSLKHVKASPTAELLRAGQKISQGERVPADIASVSLSVFEKLSSHSSERFSYGTLSGQTLDSAVRLDRFLERKVHIARSNLDEVRKAELAPHYIGHAWGAFVGKLEEIDLRDRELPAGHFRMAPGGLDIPCILYVDFEIIRACLKEQVIAEGEAVYDGTSQLPERIEIRSLKPIKGEGLSRWVGTFKDWQLPDWDEM